MPYKAFVSSTFEDLKEHRQVVIAALRKAGIFVDPMEDWTASSDEPKEFSQGRLEGCDLCILLVGFRRGHVPVNEELSITQLEYQAATKLGIDVLVFMLQEEAPWPRKFDELDKDPGIRQFRAELKESKGVGFFGLEPNSIEIAPALTRWVAEKQQSAASASPRRDRIDPLKATPGIMSPDTRNPAYCALVDDLANLQRAMDALAKLQNPSSNRTKSFILAQLHMVEFAVAPICEARRDVSALGDSSTRKDLDAICTAVEVMKVLAANSDDGVPAIALACVFLDRVKELRERLLSRI